MVLIKEPLAKIHNKARAYGDHSAVLGIDVGWSAKKPTTGLCLIEWTNCQVSLRFCEATVNEDDRQYKLNQLIQGRRLLAVGIDGPLIPKLDTTNKYRAVEALLSRGKFQQRGKPGPTNGGSGPQLHEQATLLAKLVINTQTVGPATNRYRIHKKAVAEAFPNAFLAVLHRDKDFPSKPIANRRWTDTLFPLVKLELRQLLTILLPRRKLNFCVSNIQGHERIASFICALTALCVAVTRCVAVGDQRLGYIVLPPLELWGVSIMGSSKWARDTLRGNYTGLRHQFNDIRFYRDNNPWTP